MTGRSLAVILGFLMINSSIKKLIAKREKRRQQKKNRLEKNFNWLCQEVKAIDDAGDEEKLG